MIAMDVISALGASVFFGGVALRHCLDYRSRHRTEPEDPDTPRLDWCAGCDQLRPPSYLAFTDAGLYRCALCRGEPEPVSTQKQYWEARQDPVNLTPKVIAGLRAHLKHNPENYQKLVDNYGTSWIEFQCWDCEKPFAGPAGRCPACAEVYAKKHSHPRNPELHLFEKALAHQQQQLTALQGIPPAGVGSSDSDFAIGPGQVVHIKSPPPLGHVEWGI